MIQSVKFDSSYMDIKKLANSLYIFTIKRLIEITGVFVSCIGILFFISLISYSPNDPNFIFPENAEIKNIIGFRGSYISDLFLQSVGLIVYFVPVTFIFTGIAMFRKKEIFLIVENIFYTIFYCLVGSLFFSFFYNNSFTLYINGNGGFVGNYLNQTFLNSFINSFENIIFYFLIILILALFLISINFSPTNFYLSIRKIFLIIFKKNNKNYTSESEIINEYIPQEEIKNIIQEDLPFIKAAQKQSSGVIKFKLPSIELLKIPTKKEREDFNKNENNDPAFLEKILLDFGVNGTIKKVSHGPVVTLNEFEPAAELKFQNN